MVNQEEKNEFLAWEKFGNNLPVRRRKRKQHLATPGWAENIAISTIRDVPSIHANFENTGAIDYYKVAVFSISSGQSPNRKINAISFYESVIEPEVNDGNIKKVPRWACRIISWKEKDALELLIDNKVDLVFHGEGAKSMIGFGDLDKIGIDMLDDIEKILLNPKLVKIDRCHEWAEVFAEFNLYGLDLIIRYWPSEYIFRNLEVGMCRIFKYANSDSFKSCFSENNPVECTLDIKSFIL